MREDLSYFDWKKELDIWTDFTELAAEKQGGALFLTLTGKARQAVLSGVDRDKIKSATGVKEITKCLDELFEKDKALSGYAAYDDFTSYRRPEGTSIQDYLVEFNLKYSKIKSCSMELPDGVLAYYLLKCANLSDEQTSICKATCSTLDYKTMRQQIEKVSTSAGNSDITTSESQNVPVQSQYYGLECEEEGYDHDEYPEEEEDHTYDSYYSQQPPYHQSSRSSRRVFSSSARFGPRLNAPDEFGNPTRCGFCRSIYHYVDRCPDAAKRAESKPRGRGSAAPAGFRKPGRGRGGYRGGHGGPPYDRYIWLEGNQNENDSDQNVLYTDNLHSSHFVSYTHEDLVEVVLLAEPQVGHQELLGETIGYAVIDCGCSRTVCGKVWLESFLDTLSRSDRRSVHKESDKCRFRFGDGEIFTSSEIVTLPIQIGSQHVKLRTNVVDCDVPLLLSRESLKRANAEIDFRTDSVSLLGEKVEVKVSKSGHLCVSLEPRRGTHNVKQVLFSSPLNVNDVSGNEKKILKLHKQFAHPSAERLTQLIRNSGVTDTHLNEIVNTVSQSCDVCKRFRKPPPRPAVGFPLAAEFNETVAMDIKFINGVPVLHLIGSDDYTDLLWWK